MRDALRACALLALPARGWDFLSIGDWGDAAAKTYVAAMMGDYALDSQAKFVVAIGDNMYDTGVGTVEDPQFASKFEETFVADSLNVPWYLVGGNHDYYGSIEAQVQYSQRSKRWTFPALYYKQDLNFDNVSLTLIGSDTWRLNGGDTYVAFDPKQGKGVIRDVKRLDADRASGHLSEATHSTITRNFPLAAADGPVAESSETADAEQLAQIEAWLAASTADWRVVFGHFPCYSATKGEHGDTPLLIDALVPLLVKYKVHAYLSGHDHILQHITKQGVSFFGSGTGARVHNGVDTEYAGLQKATTGLYGFMGHSLTKTDFTTTFVVNDGGSPSEPYSYIIRRDEALGRAAPGLFGETT
ncbi:Metallo-dependent phosphatase-like protein [Pelagophyceae sp. CCMP2097]|nr:Metallo-dependent phosphatase-like protein [Pelagophyceae sp. CCMP2097]